MSGHFEAAGEAFGRGDLAAALTELNGAMAAGDTRPEVLSLLGDALDAAGLPAEASEAYETAADRAGERGFADLRRATLAADKAGNRDRAYLLAMRAQRLHADDADIVYVLVREFRAHGEKEMLARFQNRLTASDNPLHLALARELIGADNRNPFNLALFRKLAALEPDNEFIRFKLMSIAREFCDYDTIEAEEAWMRRELAAGHEAILDGETPYSNLLHCDDERLNRLATNNSAIPHPPPPDLAARRRAMPHQWGERIRIGYLSADFYSSHATMRLLGHVLECHDRSRFDITLYCYTPEKQVSADDGNRSRWGRIVPIQNLSDADAAALIRSDGIDILIDLKGHTGGSRCQILNHMAAPVQVAWLGFPGSTVHVDLDYVIADAIVLPESAEPFYHEKIIRLPNCYQPNDPVHRPRPEPASRQSLGLPEHAFVFASFNAHRKITPETLVLWAEILRRRPGSILWAMVLGTEARANFLKRMGGLGIDPARIVFADMASYPDHIARLQAADLGLDSFPYNGHTTTSDMLWAGLPVLTKKGRNFASRVSESLLSAAGIEELVAADGEDFIQMGVELSADPARLVPLRNRLQAARDHAPLFDSRQFCRNLERALKQACDRRKSGMEPETFFL